MLHSLNGLIGYGVSARDGEVGKVDEFYFDDATWLIRYLILRTGPWLNARSTLISPVSVLNRSFQSGPFQLNLSRQQIRSSPDIDTDKPVSRQQEIELYGHYAWQGYGESNFYQGGLEENVDTSTGVGEIISDEGSHQKGSAFDLHLRSSLQVTGYILLGTDGEVGQIMDFLMDDDSWKLSFLIVSRDKYNESGKIRIPVSLVNKMQWNAPEFCIKGTVASIKDLGVVVDP